MPFPFDMNNDYTNAGPGAKRRRERLTLDTIPKKIARPKREREYPHRKPLIEKRRAGSVEMSEAYQSARGIKERLRYLVIDHDMGYLDCVQTMKDQGYDVSGVTISAVRSEIREVMKLLQNEGLLNVDALDKRRRKIKARGLNGRNRSNQT